MSLSSFKLPGLKRRRLFWRRQRSATITDLDPSFKVVYLGNVLTGWAKGENCTDKPLQTLWRNHLQSSKTHIQMKLTITAQGLKAFTKEHGLTEYWANKITFCRAEANYPKLFCWIYRHEGRKLKQELRCHAVLCSSQSKADSLASSLQSRLQQALFDFKLEKLSRQNARLNVANLEQAMPIRKLMLHTGSANYIRARSPPKLKAIEECSVEEEQEPGSDNNDDEEHIGDDDDVVDPEDVRVAMVDSRPMARLNPLRRSSSNPLELRIRRESSPTRARDDNEIHDDELVDEDDEDEDEDIIKDYISSVVVEQTTGEETTASSVMSSPSCPKAEMEVSSGEVMRGLHKLKLLDQDTISDESGYCEESSAKMARATLLVSEQLDDHDDLTVQSAMATEPKNINTIEDFCIHI